MVRRNSFGFSFYFFFFFLIVEEGDKKGHAPGVPHNRRCAPLPGDRGAPRPAEHIDLVRVLRDKASSKLERLARGKPNLGISTPRGFKSSAGDARCWVKGEAVPSAPSSLQELGRSSTKGRWTVGRAGCCFSEHHLSHLPPGALHVGPFERAAGC